MAIETELDDCQYCARCCMGEEVFVEDEEIEVIAERLGMNSEDFTKQQYLTRLTETIYYYLLRHKPNGDCIFLERDEKKFACTIYEFRPQFCANYPSNKRELAWCEDNKPEISK